MNCDWIIYSFIILGVILAGISLGGVGVVVAESGTGPLVDGQPPELSPRVGDSFLGQNGTTAEPTVSDDAKRFDASDRPTPGSATTTSIAGTNDDPVPRIVRVSDPSAVNRSLLVQYGATVENHHENRYRVRLPQSNISSIRGLPWVKSVSPVRPARPTRVHAGVNLTRSHVLHDLNVTGNGTAVGVISCEGIDPYHSEITDNVEATTSFRPSTIINDGIYDHGTAVAATVLDIAPEADIYAVNYADSVGYGQAVDWLVEQDVDVVVHSCIVRAQPDDGTGVYSQQTRKATQHGIPWFNAVGNNAQNHYQAQFTDTDGDGFHEVTSDGIEANALRGTVTGLRVHVLTEWDEWGGTRTNVSLVIKDLERDTVVAQSDPSHGKPYHFLSFRASRQTTYGAIIYSDDADSTTQVELNVYGSSLERTVPRGSIEAPAVVDSVAGIGAYDVPTGKRAAYSAAGPTAGGDRGVALLAPTGVDVGVYHHPFGGTSAAAPHAAGVAALLASANETASRDTIYAAMRRGATDLPNARGPHFVGDGLLNATGAVSHITAGLVDEDDQGASRSACEKSDLFEYAEEESGVVETEGLLDAAADFRRNEIGSELLLDVAGAYRSGRPIC